MVNGIESSTTTIVTSYLFKFTVHYFQKCCFLLYADYATGYKLLLTRWPWIWLNTAVSMSFDTKDKLLKGRKFKKMTSRPGFLNSGKTKSSFQMSGKRPGCIIICLTIFVKTGRIIYLGPKQFYALQACFNLQVVYIERFQRSSLRPYWSSKTSWNGGDVACLPRQCCGSWAFFYVNAFFRSFNKLAKMLITWVKTPYRGYVVLIGGFAF